MTRKEVERLVELERILRAQARVIGKLAEDHGISGPEVKELLREGEKPSHRKAEGYVPPEWEDR